VFKRNRKNLVYSLVLLLPFIFFFVRSDAFPSLKFGFVQGIAFPIRIISAPLREVKKIFFYHRTFREYMRLRNETDVLKARVVGMDELLQENARLERLLELKRKLAFSSVAAHVIGRDPSRWSSSMIIDKGRQDGLREGMPVVNALGVVGKVAEVGERKSKVVLLTDPQFSAAVLTQRTREVGLISGSLQEGICRMRYLNDGAKVSVGDTVITSKISSSFPEGLLVGEIIQIFDDPQRPSLECIVKPSVPFSQIEEVLVIVK
jgi:rod shape-determining protein MreC